MFIGEVPSAEFITGAALASQIGLTAGTSQHSDAGWLLFEDSVDGKVKYVAKRTYRHTVTWNQINARGAVFGSRTVEIKGKTYKVRLLKSVASDNIYTGGSNVYDPVGAYGSEWNRLMYPIHSTVDANASKPSPVSGEGLRYGSLAQYAAADLVVLHTAGNGSYSWCQETPSTQAGLRVLRGGLGVSYVGLSGVSDANVYFGWRPVLELIP